MTKLGFQNFYLYSSVLPESGHHFTLALPYVNTQCMNIYLEYLSKELYQIGKEAVVIMDGAGWHKSRTLLVPGNIHIEILPPYCPELNPVERLWRHIKDNVIKNRVFDSLEHIEDVVCDFVREIQAHTVQSVCRVNEVI